MNLQITGNANEQQFLSSLRAYPDRASYVSESLRGLFYISKDWTEKNPKVLQVKTSLQIISQFVNYCNRKLGEVH